MIETTLMKKVQIIASSIGARLFRNQVGTYKTIDKQGQVRYLSSGLCKGSSDLIGWRQLIITKDMVGHRMAQFTAVEVKTPGGIVSDEQIAFIGAVRNAGGLGFVCRTEKDAYDQFSQ